MNFFYAGVLSIFLVSPAFSQTEIFGDVTPPERSKDLRQPADWGFDASVSLLTILCALDLSVCLKVF